MAAGLDRTLNYQIQSIGGIGGKNHPVRVITPEELAEALADPIDQLIRFLGAIISAAPGGDPFGGVKIDHPLKDFPRFWESRGGIVQINHFRQFFLHMPQLLGLGNPARRRAPILIPPGNRPSISIKDIPLPFLSSRWRGARPFWR